MRISTLKFIGTLIIIPLIVVKAFSQGAPACPSINAGSNQSICLGKSANLAATVVSSYSTSSYSVSSIPNNAYPYSGGTQVFVNSDDVWSGVVNLPFNFCYYGNTYNQCVLGANGQLTFDLSQAGNTDGYPITTAIPSTNDQPGNTIDAVFRDIDPELGGTIDYYLTGTAPCRALVVYWKNVPLYDNDPYYYYYYGNVCEGTPNSTFELVLYENTNFIDVYVNNSYSCSGWNGGYGIIGIQNAAATAAVSAPGRNYASAWTVNGGGEAWRFSPTGSPNYSVTWTIPPSTTVIATGLTASVSPTSTTTYQANMTLTNCDGSTLTRTSQVTVTVTSGAPVSVSASPNTICNGSSTSLSASGSSTYSWSPGGQAGSSISVSPTSSTTYTVTGTDASGCQATNTVAVTVNSLPTVTSTPSPSTICSGSSTTITAGGASSYSWSPGGQTGSSITVSPSSNTTYTVTGTDGNGCKNTSQSTITVNSPPVAPTASGTSICSGNTATLTATAPGGTYNWYTSSSGGSSIHTGSSYTTPSLSSTTTYYVDATSGAGCTGPRTAVTVTVNTTPTVTSTPSPSSICNGSSTTITASGANSYTWSPGGQTGSSITVSPSSNTTYTVTGTASNGCKNTSQSTVTVNALPTVTSTPSPSSICNGNSTTITAGGASSYSWSPGGQTGSSITVSPSSTTTYTVTGTNGNGCKNTSQSTITVNALPTVTSTPSPSTICNGSSTTITAGGASSYSWSPGGQTGSSITVSPSSTTTYTVTGTNGSGCKNTSQSSITVNALPTVTSTPSPSTICNGSSTTITAGGASSYSWSPGGQNSSSITVSPSSNTTYTVTGTDGNGCKNTSQSTVTVNALPTVTSTPSPSTICNGNSTTITAGGASGYSWSPGGQTSSSITVSPSSNATYTVTGTDGNGCTNTSQATITVNPTPVAPTAAGATICSGNSATLTASAPGGTYNWYVSSTGGNAIHTGSSYTTPALNADTVFYVDATSASGCTGPRTAVTVTVSPSIPAPTTSNQAICAGDSATLTVSGSSGNYNWYTTNSGGSPFFNGASYTTPVLNSDTVYYIEAISGSGCKSTRDSITVTVNPLPVAPTAANTSICSGNTATLNATAPGGTYNWYTSSTGGSSIYTGSNYTSPVLTSDTTLYVQSTSGAGCTGPRSAVTITVNQLPTVTSTPSPSSICTGDSTMITAGGASSYSWSGGQTSAAITVNPTSTTTYTVTGADGNGCKNTSQSTITVNTLPTVTSTPAPSTICTGDSTVITANGANSYSWSGGQTSAAITVNPTSTTTYTVTGTDGNGCKNTSQSTITVNALPTVTSTPAPSTICMGDSTVITAGGASSYSWSGGQTSAAITVNPTSTATYTVTGTDGNGCKNTSQSTITVNALPTVTSTPSPSSICTGDSTVITAGGASSYSWSGGQTSTSITVNPTSTTTYAVTGTDSNGCVNTSQSTITVNTLPTVTSTPSPSAICMGDSTIITAGGASSYLWSGGQTSNSITVSPASTTSYTVTGTNGNGCSDTSHTTITVNPLPTVTSSASSSSICSGNQATITASGASSYLWSPGGQTTASVNITPSSTSTYTVLGTDGNGCMDTSQVTITVNQTPPSPTLNTTSVSYCEGDVIAPLTANGSGGTINWYSDPQLTNLVGTGSPFSPNVAATSTFYVVEVSSSGCQGDTSSVTVTINPVPPAPNVTSSSTTYCQGDTIALISATGSGGAINWYSDSSMTNQVGSGNLYTPSSNTATYWASETSSSGCQGPSTPVTVTVNPLPGVDTTSLAVTPEMCYDTSGSIVGINAVGGSSPYNYVWSDNNGNVVASSNTSPDINNLPAGSYYLTVTDANGCKFNSGPYQINNDPGVTASFTMTPDSGLAPIQIDFSNTSTNAISYYWDFGNGYTSTQENPYNVYQLGGQYQIMLIVTTTNGCADTTYQTLDLTPYSALQIPNVFSPNGDGVNDMFMLNEVGLSSLKMVIYNRWGEKIYELDGPRATWDGRTLSGAISPEGTYYYILTAKRSDGKEYNSHGVITLVR